MTEERIEPDESRVPEKTASPSRFWALPWWGWAVTSFGGVGFLSGLSILIPAIQGKSQDSESISTVLAIPMVLLMFFMLGCGFIVSLKLIMKLIGYQMPPSPRKPWMAIGGALFGCSIFLPLVAIMLAGTSPAPDTQVEAPQGIRYTFGEGKFSLYTPQSWELMDDPTITGESIRLIDPEKDLHLLAIAIPHEDLAISTVEEYSELSMTMLSQAMTNFSRDETRFMEGDTFTLADTTLEGTLEGTNLVFRLQNVKSRTHWIEIRLWTRASKYDANQELFDRILSTVQEDG